MRQDAKTRGRPPGHLIILHYHPPLPGAPRRQDEAARQVRQARVGDGGQGPRAHAARLERSDRAERRPPTPALPAGLRRHAMLCCPMLIITHTHFLQVSDDFSVLRWSWKGCLPGSFRTRALQLLQLLLLSIFPVWQVRADARGGGHAGAAPQDALRPPHTPCIILHYLPPRSWCGGRTTGCRASRC